MTTHSTMKAGIPATITRLSNRMISIKHRLNVIHQISHHIRADKCRNTLFINGAKKLKVLLVFPNESGQESVRNWIPISFGCICDIKKVGIERLARGESRWSLKGNMINSRGREVHHQERRSAWSGVQGSVSNSAKLAVRFRVWAETELEPFQYVLPDQKSEPHWTCCFLASSTFSQTPKFCSNELFELWSNHNMIYT